MNIESLQHRDLLGYLAFYDYVSNRIVKGEKNYLIFDELQAVTHWEKAIESFLLYFDAYENKRMRQTISITHGHC